MKNFISLIAMNNKTVFFYLGVVFFGLSRFADADLLTDISDASIGKLLRSHQITGTPEPDTPVEPFTSPVVKLGKKLFFSPDLSLSGAVSCASCHHPQTAGGDGLALPVGVIVNDHRLFGQKRLDALKGLYPDQYEELLIPRNSPTVFNASLYRENLFWDGRLQYLQEALPDAGMASPSCGVGGNGRLVRLGNGYSNLRPECYEEKNLLQAQARLPMVSPFEMKGLKDAHYNHHELYEIIIQRLQSNPQWCSIFRQAFAESEAATCQEMIHIDRVTEALSRFQGHLVFIDNAFFRYVKGKGDLTPLEKEGLKLFFTPVVRNGAGAGAGCAGCHSGNHLSDERFYNIGVAPYGRGANGRGLDYGRKNFNFRQMPYSFRTPSLLNVALTGPYFHNGSAGSLYQVIEAHTLHWQFQQMDDRKNKPSIAQTIRNTAKQGPGYLRLPYHLKPSQIEALIAFLNTLTDSCVNKRQCIDYLVDRQPIITEQDKADDVKQSALPLVPAPDLSGERVAVPPPPVHGCGRNATDMKSVDAVTTPLTNITRSSGLDHRRVIGLIKPGWIMDIVNWSGVSAFDIDNDCLDDLIFNDNQGNVIVYYQQPSGGFRKEMLPLEKINTTGAITPLVADIDGDYKADLFLGNSGSYFPQIIFNMVEAPSSMVLSNVQGPTLNASFGDLDQDGHLDMVMAFWRSYKSARQPQVWRNHGYRNLRPEGIAYPGLRGSYGELLHGDGVIHQQHDLPLFGDSDFTFTPNMVDFDNNGVPDVLLTADFFTSQLWQSTSEGLQDITDINVINGSFGMGAAIADFDNDGDMDWFESSIYSSERNRKYTGNRLYENIGNFNVREATEKTGLQKGGWGWGSCAADFNNDGLLDIFHATGYGALPETAVFNSGLEKQQNLQFLQSHEAFNNARPRLFINQGGMTFSEESAAWGLTEVNDGRGIVCFDYQQDGDIDIVISNWEGRPTFYRNNNTENNDWLSVKLVGLPGNTEALGAKLYLHTDQGVQYRELRFENNYVSANPRQSHFGLGRDRSIDKLVIEWPAPDRESTIITTPDKNQRLVIYHPALEQN
ncbi:cytochrome c peroxidase [Endozoicomonas sp. ALC013]|uniref:cytochrome c peroxidase n=1 Tax=Endozoicomonas sp. ALC013 TaxID=3403076 RepID=UPI003BB5413D